ncbi:conserved hypothetical/unknown protein [Nitrobacter winogradskyi Nb-255]|uniref:Type VI secretion protein n=1 Tax=Nitrobacter winogradskyi (strain ATCC 25391 / DSM 10237 / CIP 104748 / NCIMB 11846 / Nb-255) TaxID=323098 RepID=Q3SNP0_NITWN|nr:relaxase/mobilization nuclease and DUF3363 domain-containing protein [Nitrobacter winogradskyi]ABA06101.1 conserved hypothetical/unknown protein [Nitrobacter winogradskyi Nb-255]
MAARDDDRFRPKVAPPKARGSARAPKFTSRVLKAASKIGPTSTGTLRRQPSRGGARFGRGHVAAKFAGQSLRGNARRVVIKTRLVNLAKVGSHATIRHLRYIERDGVTKDGSKARTYGPGTDEADIAAFEERGREDRHQFRFIVSAEDAGDIGDLKTYTRDLMSRMEADLRTKLDWVAVDHWNTDNPHTHIVLRGRHPDGSDLVIARDYISNGMRNRARELATEWLGPRTEMEIRDGILREADQERWTGLDRMIQREAEDGVVNLLSEPAVAQARFRHTSMIGRLQKLTEMGLADETGHCVWTLHADAEATLRRMSKRGDIIRTMQRAMTGLKRDFVVLDGATAHTPVVGRIVDKGLADELYDRGYLIVDGVDGRAHYVPLAANADLESLPIGGIVETRAATERTADRTIAGLAANGIYRTDHHLAIERAKATPEHDPDSFVAAHVRRLEALRRVGIVERVEDGVWRVPADLAERGKAYDAKRLGGVDVELCSHLPIDRQTRAIGATWLDRQRFGDLSGLGQSGFGAEVRDAMRNREDYLVDQGFAERRGQRVIFARNLLATLRNREIEAAAKEIAGETGLPHHVVQDGERISGIYRRSVMLASGRFAMLDDGMGFSLVPWRPVLEKHLGQSVAGIARGNSVSWMFGRRRGMGV